MPNPNLLDIAERKKICDEINGNENLSRKRYEQRKFDIYRNRQAAYVLERLRDEFSQKTVDRMRKVLSINPCKRIVDQMGSIYAQEPERNFSGTSGEEQEKTLEDFYHYNSVDPNLRLANRYYKLCDQAALYVVPRNGNLTPRALTPKDYDVIPDADDPERAFAYILNVFDVNMHGVQQSDTKENPNQYYQNGRQQQAISNDSDRERLLQRLVVWTDEIHFTMDGMGNLIPNDRGEAFVENPIGRLPFIDIAMEKDFQFFVKRGNNIAEFTIDLLTQLSDLAEISRLQGHSQAIIYSIDEPKDLVVGPNKVMWIQQAASPDAPQPKFEFASPTPDLTAGLEIINTQLKMFLSSIGLDPATVSGKDPMRAFTSGIDHLLSNIDKFQASSEDIDLFRRVETDLFELLRDWSNEMQTVTDETRLDDNLQIGIISDAIELEVCYPEPATVQTQTEKEDSVIKRRDAKLLTRKDAIKELYDFDDKKADEYIAELDKEKAEAQEAAMVPMVDADGKPVIGPDGKPQMQPDPKATPPTPPADEPGSYI